MPLDPEISLRAGQGGAAPGASTSANPLAMMLQFQQLQNLRNQNQQFQQTFAAKQRAGQILATSPDLETGLSALYGDPATAAFASDIANSVRAAKQTQTGIEKTQQEIAQAGVKGFLTQIPSAGADPNQFDKIYAGYRNTIPASQQTNVDKAVDSIRSSLFDNLPSDPAQAKQQYLQRYTGTMLGAGFNPDAIHEMIGTPAIPNLGGALQPGLQAPAYMGGGFSASGPSLPLSLAPQIANLPVQGGEGATQPTIVGGGGGLPTAPRGTTPNAGSPLTLPGAIGGQTPSVPDAAMYSEGTKNVMDYIKNLQEGVAGWRISRKNIDNVIDAAKETQLGGGADIYGKLAQAAQAFGVHNDNVDQIAGGNLAALQDAQKINNNNAVNQIMSQIKSSRLNEKEFVSALSSNPSVVMDPRAMVKIFNLWNDIGNMHSEELNQFTKYSHSGQPIRDWPNVWNQSDYMKNFAPTDAISGQGVKGVPQTPTIPSGLQGKEGLQYSPSRKQWRDAGGALYAPDGTPVGSK